MKKFLIIAGLFLAVTCPAPPGPVIGGPISGGNGGGGLSSNSIYSMIIAYGSNATGTVTIPTVNNIVFASGTTNFLSWTNQVVDTTISSRGIANSLSTITNNGANYGPDTPGTVTCGIQEAWNNANKGTQYGPKMVPVSLRCGDGDFFYTNVVTMSNNYTTFISLKGNGLASRLIYAGTANNTNCFTIRGGGNPLGGALDLPMHVVVEDLTFSAINENTNVILRITNYSGADLSRLNFTSYRIMTNNSWGSAVSINGGALYESSQGLVGLVIGNGFEHATFVRDCYFAGLATGVHFLCDHAYADGMKFAFIGVDGLDNHNNLFPTNSPYHLGSCILRSPGLNSTYRNIHLYVANAGISYLNTASASSDYQMVENLQIEGCDHTLASIYPLTVPFLLNQPEQDISGNGGMWRITGVATNYGFTTATIFLREAIYDYNGNIVSVTSLTNRSITSAIPWHDANGKANELIVGSGLSLSAGGTLTASGGTVTLPIDVGANNLILVNGGTTLMEVVSGLLGITAGNWSINTGGDANLASTTVSDLSISANTIFDSGGKATWYGGSPTYSDGPGVVPVRGGGTAVNQAAAIGTINILGTSVAGTSYLVGGVVSVKTTAAVGIISLTLSWTAPSGSTTKSVGGIALTTAGETTIGPFPIVTANTDPVTYITTVTTPITGSPAYDVRLWVQEELHAP